MSTVDEFIETNHGELADYAPWSLIDNIVVDFNFGTLFCFETYENEWSSSYTLYFFPYGRERGIKKMWERFNALKQEE